jgi:hypothetical protein
LNQPIKTLTNEQQRRIFDGAAFVSEDEITEAYYDNERYGLTTANRWLRSRDGVFDMKVPRATNSDDPTVHSAYFTLGSEREIRSALRLGDDHESLDLDLYDAGYSAFCVARIVRRRFRKEGVSIDVNDVTYDDSAHTYTISSARLEGEPSPDEQSPSPRQVAVMAGESIRIAASFLMSERPLHYDVLVANNVVRL